MLAFNVEGALGVVENLNGKVQLFLTGRRDRTSIMAQSWVESSVISLPSEIFDKT